MELEGENEETNLNTDYEIFAQEVYKLLLKADGYENIEVKHNIKLVGKSSCLHQIDVFWEFKLAAQTFRVAIECKNYSNEVSIGRVRDFFGVIHDIGNINGIIVTKKGFQAGAKKFADFYSITLQEIRRPDENDWEGRLKNIVGDINLLSPIITGIAVQPDITWLKDNYQIEEEEDIKNIGLLSNIPINALNVLDKDGLIIENFSSISQKLPHNSASENGLSYVFNFDDAYANSDLGNIKIIALKVVYDINITSSKLFLDAEEITKAIVKDVKSGQIKFINKDGRVM